MLRRTVVICSLALLLAGCAQPSAPAPLATDHPANPDAPESPLPPQSQTLSTSASTAPVAQGGNAAPPLATRPGENAALSAPRMTPTTLPATQSATKYTCPMHPEVVSDKPGKCPKCGMTLIPAHAGHGGHS